jgi:hypothetical protein
MSVHVAGTVRGIDPRISARALPSAAVRSEAADVAAAPAVRVPPWAPELKLMHVPAPVAAEPPTRRGPPGLAVPWKVL